MTLPGKKETLLACLGRGVAMIHLDARRGGVAVPEQHAGDPHLRLNLSLLYGIPDLLVDDEKVQATLSFRGRPFQCKLPWSAVFGITSDATGDGQVWPEDLPGEVISQLERPEAAEPEAPVGEGEPPPDVGGTKTRPVRKRREPARKRPALVAVESAEPGADAGRSQAAKASAAGPEKHKRHTAEPVAPAPEAPAAPDAAPRRGHLRLVR